MTLTGIPYGNPAYFIPLVLALLPMILGLLAFRRRLPIYEALFSLAFLGLCFGGLGLKQTGALCFYVIWQLALAKFWLRSRARTNRSATFYGTIAASLLPLIVMKITPLATGTPSILEFLGISFLTFRSLQVLIEVRDDLIKSLPVRDYLRFLLFFPALSSGPIDRYRRFVKELHEEPEPGGYVHLLTKGIHHIFMGLLYKFVLGYIFSFGLGYLENYALALHGSPFWTPAYMYAYSLYLFFDFAGYSRFAVGVGNLMGYDLPENFNKPFLSHNIKDFWNRWHMSLSFWFRDYVYMRLLFVFTKKKVFKSRLVSSNVCYLCLFLLMGVWHGLTWYYVAYGLYHALLICLTDAWLRFKKKHKARLPSGRLTLALSVFLTFHAVCFSFLIFSGFLSKLAEAKLFI